MDSKRPVVVYGANGFSGRLIVEYLREFNVPFIAAGRSRERLENVIHHVPGIETADYEIAEVGESVDELADDYGRQPLEIEEAIRCELQAA